MIQFDPTTELSTAEKFFLAARRAVSGEAEVSSHNVN